MKKNDSRAVKAANNMATGLFKTFVSLFASFLNRTLFLMKLDATYLGVNGLFSNVVLIFSLAELGIGAALTQMMYKPLAEHDDAKLASVFKLTKRIMNTIGIIIFVVGMCFTPFLEFIVEDINAVPNMRVIFILFTVSTASTYFYSYYTTLITADQKAYKLFGFEVVGKIFMVLCQNAVLFITEDYVFYLITQIFVTLAINFCIRVFVRKQYSFFNIKSIEPLPHEEIHALKKNTVALFLYRVSMTVTEGTDNIIAAKFTSLVLVGLASNYTLIIQAARGFAESIMNSLLATVGNICATESTEKKKLIYDRLNCISGMGYSFVAICIFVMINPFIQLWLGDEYLLPISVPAFMCMDIFLQGSVRVSSLYRTAEGLFWYGKFRPLAQAIINLVGSIILVQITGELWAIFAGTVLSRLLTTVWYDPLIIFKYVFFKSPVSYYRMLVEDTIGLFLIAIAVYTTSTMIDLLLIGELHSFILKLLITVFLTFILLFILNFRKCEFRKETLKIMRKYSKVIKKRIIHK